MIRMTERRGERAKEEEEEDDLVKSGKSEKFKLATKRKMKKERKKNERNGDK